MSRHSRRIGDRPHEASVWHGISPKLDLWCKNSALVALAIPLLAGLLINLIIVLSSKIVDINSTDWLRFFAIFLLSILFLSVFLLLGMFVSSRVYHSISSIVILLLIWAGLVVLIPSFGRIVAETSVNVTTLAEFRKRFMENWQQMERDAEAGKYGRNAHELWHEDRNHPSVNPPAAARYCNAKVASINKLWEERHNRMLAQAYAGRNFASISPAVIYQRASETVAGTGIRRCVDLYRLTNCTVGLRIRRAERRNIWLEFF